MTLAGGGCGRARRMDAAFWRVAPWSWRVDVVGMGRPTGEGDDHVSPLGIGVTGTAW